MDETIHPADPLPSDPSAAEPSPSNHGATWVFLGPSGLRAGWSILLFAIIFIATDFLVGWLLHAYMHRLALAAGVSRTQMSAVPLQLALLQEVVQVSGIFPATVVMARLESRPIMFYGYQGQARSIRFLSGIASGFAAISALVLVLWKAGYLSLDGVLLHGPAVWAYAAGWAFFFLIVAIFEESLFRGYIQYTLTRGIGFWWGALFFAFLFGFSHGNNPGESPVGLFSAAFIGLVFCLSLWYTGSLWWALGFHAAWDWGESYFYGTSDSGMLVKGHLLAEHPRGSLLRSGGPTGPEGSILVLPLIAIMTLLMWLWWHTRAEKPFSGSAWKPKGVQPSLPSAP